MRERSAERILRECFRSFAPLPNAVLLQDERVDGAMTRVPITFFSGIAATRFDEHSAPSDAAEIAARFREEHRPFRWWLTPSTQPHTLESILQSLGMRHAYDATGMEIELRSLQDVRVPDGVAIRRLVDADDMHHWTDVFLPVFSRDAHEGAVWIDTYGRLGFDGAWIHFVAFVNGTAAATTSLLMCGDLAGIYHVATLPSFRGRGIGAALTMHALHEARARGASIAALQSSAMGYPVYRALGFESVCELRLYDWR